MSDPLQQLSEGLAGRVAQAAGSVVRVKGARVPASGTVWGDDLVVCPTHALGGRDEGFIQLHDGTERKAKVIGRDAATDLSLLRIDGGGLAVPKTSDGAGLKVGHLVVSVARPGHDPEAALGMLRGLGGPWSTRLGAPIDRRLEVDGDLPRGFSGGPLIGDGGVVLGVNTHGLLRGGTTVPTSTVDRVVAALEAHGEIKPGWLGVGVQPAALSDEQAQTAGRPRALLVSTVLDGGPAEASGVRVGDLLVEVAGRSLIEVEDLLAALSGRADEEVKVTLLRGAAKVDLTATATVRPQRKHHGRRRGGGGHGANRWHGFGQGEKPFGRRRRHGHGGN